MDLNSRISETSTLKGIFFKEFYTAHKLKDKNINELFQNKDILEKMVRYRLGFNEANEYFDITIKNLYRGLEALTMFNVSIFPPQMAKTIYQTKGCLNRNFGLIAVQKENIKGWHAGLFGKQVQQSAIGGIMRGIKQLPQTQKPVDKFFPSTQLCPECKTLNKIGLDERTYVCPACGYTKDRDTHSAGNILEETLKTSQIPTVRRDFKPVEKSASAFLRLSQNCKWISVKQEATQL